ncbi:MAG: cytochrome-c oxidase, cbb3-type subunit III [Hyphomicrobiales bacterium]
MSKRDVDQHTGIETTGHEWDGIKELNNPLPRWWLLTFYATIIFAIGYCVVYPAIPGLSGASKGLWGWSSRHDVQAAMDAVTQSRAAMEDKIAATDIKTIIATDDLKQYATSAGASMFKTYCSQCHGSGAQGAVGYPNLNDDDWLWGGTPEQIVQTLTHGVRYVQDPDTRNSQMPAFGKDAILDAAAIGNVAQYVLKLSGAEHDEAAATTGQQLFTDNCAACHGANGEGNQDVGAPKLADAIWLYNGGAETITAQINNPRHGVMPAWGRLGDAKVKELAAYVISLGGSK